MFNARSEDATFFFSPLVLAGPLFRDFEEISFWGTLRFIGPPFQNNFFLVVVPD